MPRVLTNKYGLPDMIVKAVQYDTHAVAGEISVSQLIDSPRIRFLKQRHVYEEDVADLLDALLGTAMHHVLERATMDNVRKMAFQLTMETLLNHHKVVKDEQKKESMFKIIKYLKQYSDVVLKVDDRYETEKTLRWEVDGVVVYGTRDLYDNLTQAIEDYKSTKVWTWIFEESRLKWMLQLNMYAFLSIMNGYDVKHLIINAFFKDWSMGNLNRNKDYPPKKIMRIPIELFSIERLTTEIHYHVKRHKDAMTATVLPDCSGLERWAEADQYAIKTPGIKRSIKNFDDKVLARNWLQENGHKHKNAFIELRPGDSKRCAEYCPVAKFCDQRAVELKRQEEEAKSLK